MILFANQYDIFQSTLPRGERHVTPAVVCQVDRDFNPRSHEGSDQCGSDNRQQYRYFNPRSHEGSDGVSGASDMQ